MTNSLIRKDTPKQYRMIHKLLTNNPPMEFNNDSRSSFGSFGLSIIILALVFISSCGRPPLAFGAENKIVEIAESQIGKGEIGGDNKGEVVKMYTKGKEVAWCAGFVSFCWNRAGARGHYFLSALSFWQNKVCRRVSIPQPGDVIVLSRGSHQGHVGIVERVQGSSITTIEGNVGKFPATVRRITYNINHIPHLLGFVRLT